MKTCRVAGFIFLVLLIILPIWQQGQAATAVITVTTTNDELNTDGDCSLREAIHAANSNSSIDACPAGTPGEDTLSLPSGIFTLNISDAVEENNGLTGDLDLTENIVINGSDQTTTVIDGNDLDRVFHVPFGGTAVTLNNLTIQGGSTGTGTGPQYSGGGLSLISGSTVTLTHVTITQNTAAFGNPLMQSGSGGGIYNNGGTLILNNVSITHNRAGFAGGIYNGGILTMTNSTVANNETTFYGAGVQHNSSLTTEPRLIIRESSIINNTAATNGGGLYLSSGTADLRNVTVSGNVADSYLGGGIWVYYEGSAVSISHSTIVNNTAGTGGGIYNTHTQGLMSSDIPNQGNAATIQIKNSIIADNIGGNCGRSLQTNPIVSLGYNLDSGESCQFNTLNHDLINTAPQLRSLQNYGGPTLTHLPPANSPVLDQGICTDIMNNPVTGDQRGIERPQNNQCDIGAVEFVEFTNVLYLPLVLR